MAKEGRQNYTIVDNGIMEDMRVGKHALVIYFVLCKFKNNKDHTCFPGLSTIAKYARCSRSSAQTGIQELIDLGYVQKENRRVEKGYTSNQYIVNSTPTMPDTGIPTDGMPEDNISIPESGTPPIPDSGIGIPPGGKEPIPMNYTNLELDPLTKRQWIDHHKKRLKNRGPVEYPQEFEDWWVAYGVPKGKKAAFKCWLISLEHMEPEILKQAAVKYIAECNRENRYKKNPATFLGPDEHWRDYINAARASPGDWEGIPDHMDGSKHGLFEEVVNAESG